MCQQVLQFCSGVTKPLLFAGGLLSFLLAVAIGYTGYTTNALYNDIDPQVAANKAMCYHAQLAASVYLALVTVFSCYAAHYDQKHSIRGLAIVSTLNLVVALAAIFLLPSGQELTGPVSGILKEAQAKYNFQDRPSVGVDSRQPQKPELDSGILVMPSTGANTSTSEQPAKTTETPNKQRDTSAEVATRMWDSLQERGCCGLSGGADWSGKIPKSCCAKPTEKDNSYTCEKADDNHKRGCLALIEATSLNLLIVLALIALVNFYLATISGLGAYKTLSYSEASQNAYT